MKKVLALIVVCLLAVSIFAGCGSSNTTETQAATEAAATDAADAAATDAAATDAAADGASADNSAIVGVWATTDFITADGTVYKIDEYAKANNVEVDAIMVTYTFTEDGKATCAMQAGSVDGTYTFDGTTVTTSFEAASPVFEYDAEKNILTNSEDPSGVVSVLGKAA